MVVFYTEKEKIYEKKRLKIECGGVHRGCREHGDA